MFSLSSNCSVKSWLWLCSRFSHERRKSWSLWRCILVRAMANARSRLKLNVLQQLQMTSSALAPINLPCASTISSMLSQLSASMSTTMTGAQGRSLPPNIRCNVLRTTSTKRSSLKMRTAFECVDTFMSADSSGMQMCQSLCCAISRTSSTDRNRLSGASAMDRRGERARDATPTTSSSCSSEADSQDKFRPRTGMGTGDSILLGLEWNCAAIKRELCIPRDNSHDWACGAGRLSTTPRAGWMN
mmetsp:Transcript_129090/g.413697  ORF Transcript_129090/g.413697 Transcript_129090/m.413697 type:complete len:244 (+) Transcript_129090:1013-1744(+)